MTEFQAALSRFLSGQLDFPALEDILVRTLQTDPASADSSLQALDQLFRTSRLPAQIYISLKQKIAASQAQPPASPQQAPPAQQPGATPPQTPTELGGSQTSAQPQSPNIIDIVQPKSADPTTPTLHEQMPPPVTPSPQDMTGGAIAPPPESSATPSTQEPSSDILDILQSKESDPQLAQPPGQSPAESGITGAPAADLPPSDDKTVFRQSAPTILTPGQQSGPHSAGTGSFSQTGGFTGPGGGMSIPTGGTGTGTGSSWTDPSKWGAGPAPTMQPGSILKDRYVLEVVIGRGGMGVVFKAKDLRREEAQDRNPYVAVKILNDEFRRHPESLKALQRESRKAQDLAHPNIVTVFDFDRDGAIVYMTMEFLEGQALDSFSRSASFDGMPLSEAYPLIEAMGLALAYAHQKGIVHSDFKPANVFLTNGGIIKIFDFGIARAAKLPDDKSGDMTVFDPGSLGALTPAYASCEMLDGEEPDARDDIYALACVAYELLTGKHPFGKRSAAEARDKKIVLVTVKGLTRRQWRGIQRGLAFRREARSPNVDAFLEDLRPRTINKAMLAGVAAVAAAFIIFGILVGPSIYQGYQVDRRVEEIVASNDTEIPFELEQMTELNEAGQETVKGNSAVRDRLVSYFEDQISLAQEELDYPRAESLADDALELYPDSNRIISATDVLNREKNDLLSALINQFNAHLQEGRLLPAVDEDDITDVLGAYEQIDPGNPTLTDSRLAIAYAEAAERALATDVGLAEQYLTEWQRRFPDDPLFADLRDRLNTLRDVQDRDVRVAELQQQLTEQYSSLNAPEDFIQLESEFLRLETLAPNDALVDTYRNRVQELTSARVGELLNQNDWVGAEQLLTQVQRFIGPEYRTATMASINDAETAYTGRIGSMLEAVTQAVQNGEFSQAEASLAQLEQQGAAAGALREARTTISRGYLDSARVERAAGQFGNARDLAEAGQRADSDFTDWTQELIAIADAERFLAEGLAEEDLREREQQRLASIEQLTDRIQANLALAEFGIDSAQQTLVWIDQLGRLDPSASLSTVGRNEVALKLATKATGAGFEDGLWEDALELVTQAIELIPGENVLRQARERLQNERNNVLARVAVEEDENLKANLDRLLAAPRYDTDWETQLRGNVQSLEPLASNSAYLNTKRREIAQAYVGQAESLFAENRFDLAEQMLNSSEWFVPEFDPAGAVRQRLASAMAEFKVETLARQKAAEIDGLKRTFGTELNAARIPDARNALAQLQKLLQANDPYLTSEAPAAIANTFLLMATRARDESRFDNAERLAQEGLREAVNHPALTNLLTNIVVLRLDANVDELQNIINEAPPEDAVQPKNMLARVKEDAGNGYADIEANLMALAKKRVSDSPRVNQKAFDDWFSNIFDGYVPLQNIGTPCTRNLAGAGRRTRGQCFDYLTDATTRGPRLVVVPNGNGVAEPFAIARQEISVRQWNDYCRLSGNCAPSTTQSEQMPITNIGLDQALAYATWLSGTTNYVYRLPTDAEWVHAATADGSGGVSPICMNPQAGTGDQLLEVNRGGQNSWGVKNYIGNAQEWVTVPSGGYVARGGAYSDRLGNCKVDFSRPHAGTADNLTGFRLVRELAEGA